MNDDRLVELFWARNECALSEARREYGAYCLSIAHNMWTACCAYRRITIAFRKRIITAGCIWWTRKGRSSGRSMKFPSGMRNIRAVMANICIPLRRRNWSNTSFGVPFPLEISCIKANGKLPSRWNKERQSGRPMVARSVAPLIPSLRGSTAHRKGSFRFFQSRFHSPSSPSAHSRIAAKTPCRNGSMSG